MRFLKEENGKRFVAEVYGDDRRLSIWMDDERIFGEFLLASQEGSHGIFYGNYVPADFPQLKGSGETFYVLDPDDYYSDYEIILLDGGEIVIRERGRDEKSRMIKVIRER